MGRSGVDVNILGNCFGFNLADLALGLEIHPGSGPDGLGSRSEGSSTYRDSKRELWTGRMSRGMTQGVNTGKSELYWGRAASPGFPGNADASYYVGYVYICIYYLCTRFGGHRTRWDGMVNILGYLFRFSGDGQGSIGL